MDAGTDGLRRGARRHRGDSLASICGQGQYSEPTGTRNVIKHIWQTPSGSVQWTAGVWPPFCSQLIAVSPALFLGTYLGPIAHRFVMEWTSYSLFLVELSLK